MVMRADWLKVSIIMFIIGLVLIYLANNFVSGFSLSISPIIFIVILGIGLYIVARLFAIERAREAITLQTLLVYAVAIAGIVLFFWKFPQFIPTHFSVIMKKTFAMVRLP